MTPTPNRRADDKTLSQMAIDQAVILNKLENLNDKVDTISDKIEKNYVTQDQFEPVKKIVYGLVGIILFGVVGAILALVINK